MLDRQYLGNWPTQKAAAQAYDRAARRYRPSSGRLNYPKLRLRPADATTLRVEARALTKARTTSRFRGVNWNKRTRRWMAAIYSDGILSSLGGWATEKEAAEAYDRAARFILEGKACLNFPNRHLAPARPAEVRRTAEKARKISRATSQYRGVRLGSNDQSRPWIAQLSLRRKGITHLGSWPAEKEAAEVYDRAARFYLGRRAVLNFPDRKLGAADMATLRAEARQQTKKTRSSRYLGVFWWKTRGIWAASIVERGRRFHLGYFAEEREAGEAYDNKSVDLRGPRAMVNFHPKTGEPVWGKRLMDLDVP